MSTFTLKSPHFHPRARLAQHGVAPAQKNTQHSPAQNPASTKICAGAEKSCAGLRCALACAGNPALGLRWRWTALVLACAVRWLRWRWAALRGHCAGAALALDCAGAVLRWRWTAVALQHSSAHWAMLPAATSKDPGGKLKQTTQTNVPFSDPGKNLNTNVPFSVPGRHGKDLSANTSAAG